jgi:putrescine transport system substrate-binding protein
MRYLTRRGLLNAGAATLAAPFLSRMARAQGGSLFVYNWADYIGETTIDDFMAETGIDVVYDLYSSAEEMQAKMLAGSTGYDVVFTAGRETPRFAKAGVYQTIDHARLPGWKNLDPVILQIMEGWDPGNQYGVPYMWGSTGFTFNVDMVKERIPDADMTDMALIFDPANAAKLADCGISILDSPDDILPMVAGYLGLPAQDMRIEDMPKLIEAFKPIREHIRVFDNTNYLNSIPNKEVCVVNNWSGDYATVNYRAAEAGITDLNLAYFVPKTGAPIWADMMSIPSDAGNVDNAYLFLEYMLRPDVAAGCTNYTYYATGNLAAKALLDASILEDPAIYPDEATMARMYAPAAASDAQAEAVLAAWQAIKFGE